MACKSLVATLGVALLAVTSSALCQSAEQKRRPQATDAENHSIVFEVGAAGSWSRGEPLRPGGTLALEVTPIEKWLELEFGGTATRVDRGVEMTVDMLFKKPWQISRTFEFMIGVGPELVHATGSESGTYWGTNAVLDFMFWPRNNLGWYVEPGYEATFHDGTRHGLGFAAGILIGR